MDPVALAIQIADADPQREVLVLAPHRAGRQHIAKLAALRQVAHRFPCHEDDIGRERPTERVVSVHGFVSFSSWGSVTIGDQTFAVRDIHVT